MATKTRAPTSDFATGGTVAYSSGTTGYNLTNDYPDTADPLTSYVTLGTTANSFIAFGFTAMDVPTGSTINSVQVQYTDEEPSNGANTAAGRLRIGGTYYDAATHNPSTTTTARADSWTNNPRTAAAWTVADVNGSGSNPLQNFGVIGPDSNPAWRIGSIQLYVDYTPPVTGSLAATESGADTFAASGDVIVAGPLGATESGADAFAASGTVADSPVTGSFAATESGADSFAAAGVIPINGTLAATETGGDTLAATGTVPVSGALAGAEAGADNFAASGAVIVQGAFGASEAGADTLDAGGQVIVQGPLGAAETGQDTFTASGGQETATGALSATEAGQDALAALGGPVVSGACSASESGLDIFVGLPGLPSLRRPTVNRLGGNGACPRPPAVQGGTRPLVSGVTRPAFAASIRSRTVSRGRR